MTISKAPKKYAKLPYATLVNDGQVMIRMLDVGLNHLPAMDQDVRNDLIRAYRATVPHGDVFRVHRGKDYKLGYYIALEREAEMITWITDPANQRVAEAATAGLRMGAGSRKKKSGKIEMSIDGEKFRFDGVENLEKFVNAIVSDFSTLETELLLNNADLSTQLDVACDERDRLRADIDRMIVVNEWLSERLALANGWPAPPKSNSGKPRVRAGVMESDLRTVVATKAQPSQPMPPELTQNAVNFDGRQYCRITDIVRAEMKRRNVKGHVIALGQNIRHRMNDDDIRQLPGLGSAYYVPAEKVGDVAKAFDTYSFRCDRGNRGKGVQA